MSPNIWLHELLLVRLSSARGTAAGPVLSSPQETPQNLPAMFHDTPGHCLACRPPAADLCGRCWTCRADSCSCYPFMRAWQPPSASCTGKWETVRHRPACVCVGLCPSEAGSGDGVRGFATISCAPHKCVFLVACECGCAAACLLPGRGGVARGG